MRRYDRASFNAAHSVYCFDPGSDSPQSMWLLTGEVWPREFPAHSLNHFDITKQMTESRDSMSYLSEEDEGKIEGQHGT